MERYDHKAIEPKWQKSWEEQGLFAAGKESSRPKKYWLETFPYPSGAGLHAGHPRGYTASDISVRYFRMKGFDVLYPIGWDAFGLPTENYAIKAGISPQKATDDNVANFTRQLKSFGFSYDWSRLLNTSDPAYYKWTQWIFKILFDNGYAYQKEGYVNWCPKDQTVLANEQVVDGKCERCGTVIEQKKMNQWFFKITDFAEELLSGLDQLDWPESTKAGQRNWIGKSEGAEITFAISEFSDRSVTVFTTRPDTLWGATFLVISPETAQEWIANGWEAEAAVVEYIQKSLAKTQRSRLEGAGEKTGVDSGIHAINPATTKQVPIWVADYVLGGYGTGAIMAVPAHDERDFEFAKKFGLGVTQVVSGEGELPTAAHGVLINSGEWDGLTFEKVMEEISASKYSWAKTRVQYKIRDWSVSRQRYWGAPLPVIYDKDGKPRTVEVADLPVLLPTDVDATPTGEPPLSKSVTFQNGVEEKYGEGSMRSVETLDTFVDSAWYYLRYCDPSNGEAFASSDALKKWMPVDTYIIGAEHTNMHLLYARYITKALHKLGYVEFNEPFLKVRHQGLIMGTDGEKMSKSRGNVINPDELIEQYGADTVRMYEMFMGPFDQAVAWDTNGVSGVRKFLDRLYGRALIDATSAGELNEGNLNRLIKKVTEDIEVMKFNTIVSSAMEYLNNLGEEGSGWIAPVIKILAPVIPHLAEEIWQGALGNTKSIFEESWPTYDPSKIKTETVEVAVQRNGKLRGTVTLASGTPEAVAVATVNADTKLATAIEGHSRVVYVTDKIINFVG